MLTRNMFCVYNFEHDDSIEAILIYQLPYEMYKSKKTLKDFNI